jgi:hypothetical protein
MMTIDFPVFVLARDSGEILRYNSLLEMRHYVERIDVENQEYLAWDANERPIRMTVAGAFGLWLEPVAASKPDKAGLMSALRHFAEIRGVQLGVEDHEESPALLYEKIMANEETGGVLGRALKLFSRRRRVQAKK